MFKKDVSPSDFPGPCTYDSSIPKFKPFYDDIKVSRNFISGRKNRFGNEEAEFTFL